MWKPKVNHRDKDMTLDQLIKYCTDNSIDLATVKVGLHGAYGDIWMVTGVERFDAEENVIVFTAED